ncbi:hypothetical protein F4775DRAFT_553901 [Biscogniauxia sp. FL1348]|nr:hypothetical protein F4775DRAFT_553901 [Biscogniauxia sp. FL1348]
MKLPPEVRCMIYSAITPDEGFEFTVKVYQDLNTLNIIPPHDDFRVLPPYGRVCREMRFAILNQYCPVVLTCEFCPRKYCRMPGPDDAEFEDVYGYLHLTKDSLTVISDNHPRWVDPPMDLEPGCEFPICLGHTTTIRVKSLDLCFSLDHWDIPGREFDMDLYDTMAPPDEALNENGNLGEIPMEFDQETESDTDAYDVYDDDEDDENDDDDF